jgi:glycosyltransferase involved in cell wall biosynthesis
MPAPGGIVTGDPLVSFIVLSYNYENYIGTTLGSILGQTEQRFEIVVVDDASTDGSREVVRSFGDPRIRLHVNDRNMGGAATYNRAVTLARGEFLVNLDADDWIDPRKTAIQLAMFARDPSLDILGTHVSFVDASGEPHPSASELEAGTNQAHDLNLVDSWVVQNRLCRSSTMLKRSVHERIGLDDASMVRAPDYELWTRALRCGCRFWIVPERLTSLRLHSRGVTHANPGGTFREICHLLLKNMVPLIEKRATYPSLARIFEWITAHDQFVLMRPVERYRLLGMLLASAEFDVFSDFDAALSADGALPGDGADAERVGLGRRYLALQRSDPRRGHIEKLQRDVQMFIEARDFFRQQAENWQREAENFRKQSEAWELRAKQRLDARIASGLRRLLARG